MELIHLSGRGRGGRLFEAGCLLAFSTFRMGAYSRWALIRGWALIRINTVIIIAITRTLPPKIFQNVYLESTLKEDFSVN